MPSCADSKYCMLHKWFITKLAREKIHTIMKCWLRNSLLVLFKVFFFGGGGRGALRSLCQPHQPPVLYYTYALRHPKLFFIQSRIFYLNFMVWKTMLWLICYFHISLYVNKMVIYCTWPCYIISNQNILSVAHKSFLDFFSFEMVSLVYM